MRDSFLKPRFIPAAEINALADAMIHRHVSRAKEIAFAEEDRAWLYVNGSGQGKWHRVRHELWQRYEAGERAGPDD